MLSLLEMAVLLLRWVVVDASNRKNFPDLFKRQFKMVSLESEVEKTIGIDRDRKLLKHKEKEKKKKRRQRIPDNKFKQLCKKSKRTLPKRIRRKNFFQRGVGDVKIA